MNLRNIYGMKTNFIIDSLPTNGRKNIRETYRKFARHVSNFLMSANSKIIIAPYQLAPGKFSINLSFKDNFILQRKKIGAHTFFAERLSQHGIKRIVFTKGAKHQHIIDLIHKVCSIRSKTADRDLKDFNRPNIKIEFKKEASEKHYVLTPISSQVQIIKVKVSEHKELSTPRALIESSRELERKCRKKGPELMVTHILDWIDRAKIEINTYIQEIRENGWRPDMVKQRSLYVHLGIRVNTFLKLLGTKPEKIEIPEYS